MISTVKVFFLDKPCGKKDGGLPVNELKFEKDIIATDILPNEKILEHVQEVKKSIQRLYTGAYCDYFRLVYRLGTVQDGNIVSEEFDSTKELKKFEFKSDEEFDKHNLTKSDFKKAVSNTASNTVSSNAQKDVSAVKSESTKVRRADKSVKSSKVEEKTEVKTVKETHDSTLDITALKKKKLSLQSKMSRLKKEGQSTEEIEKVKKEIEEINRLIKFH